MHIGSDLLPIAVGIFAINLGYQLLRRYGPMWRHYERATVIARIIWIVIWIGLGITSFIQSSRVFSFLCAAICAWESFELHKQIAKMNRSRRGRIGPEKEATLTNL